MLSSPQYQKATPSMPKKKIKKRMNLGMILLKIQMKKLRKTIFLKHLTLVMVIKKLKRKRLKKRKSLKKKVEKKLVVQVLSKKVLLLINTMMKMVQGSH